MTGKKTQQTGRKPKPSVDSRLVAYSVAAGAAGAVGLVGTTAQAVIISDSPNALFGQDHGDLALTMEGSNAEVVLRGGSSHASMSNTVDHLVAEGDNDNFRLYAQSEHFGMSNSRPAAIALGQGDEIGPASHTPNKDEGFFAGHVQTSNSVFGQWAAGGGAHYFGFSFDLETAGTTVYGWGEVENIDDKNGELLSWAYENDGSAIAAGDTGPGSSPPSTVPDGGGTLALLALGAAGVAALRRTRKDSKSA